MKSLRIHVVCLCELNGCWGQTCLDPCEAEPCGLDCYCCWRPSSSCADACWRPLGQPPGRQHASFQRLVAFLAFLRRLLSTAVSFFFSALRATCQEWLKIPLSISPATREWCRCRCKKTILSSELTEECCTWTICRPSGCRRRQPPSEESVSTLSSYASYWMQRSKQFDIALWQL